MEIVFSVVRFCSGTSMRQNTLLCAAPEAAEEEQHSTTLDPTDGPFVGESLGTVQLPSTASRFTRMLTEKRPSGWTETSGSSVAATVDLLQSRKESRGLVLHPLDVHDTKS